MTDYEWGVFQDAQARAWAAEKDAKRLQWLEDNHNHISIWPDYDVDMKKIWCVRVFDTITEYATLRQAIDALSEGL